MGCLRYPFQVISNELIIGRARVLKRVCENDGGMRNWLFLIDFLLDLEYGLIIRFVVLYQKFNILFLGELAVNNPDQFDFDGLANTHLAQTLNDFLLKPLILILMQVLADLERQEDEVLFVWGDQLREHRSHLVVLV